MEEGNLVLCTVEKVTNTVTIVKLPNGKEGTIISSEIAPGRIKLMRQYVVPNKKIVCKVLNVSGNNINLSLRRVNSKEKKEVMQEFKQKQTINAAFRQIFGENENKITKIILENFKSLPEFVSAARTNPSIIIKFIPKDKEATIRKIIEKKRKNQELKQIITIKCLENDGVKRIKEVFDIKDSDVTVNYISAGNLTLKLSVEDFKKGKVKMAEILEELKRKAKSNNCEFYATEQK
jgi:translation initiation factor 2 alpha subunit (eIF-2alpha)